MVLYEIKLISHENNEVLFRSLDRRVVLPPPDISRKFPKATLYVTTIDSKILELEQPEKSKAA